MPGQPAAVAAVEACVGGFKNPEDNGEETQLEASQGAAHREQPIPELTRPAEAQGDSPSEDAPVLSASGNCHGSSVSCSQLGRAGGTWNTLYMITHMRMCMCMRMRMSHCKWKRPLAIGRYGQAQRWLGTITRTVPS